MRTQVACLALSAMLLAGGCGTTSRVAPAPQALATQAVVPGFSDIRYFVPADAERLAAEYDRSVDRELQLTGVLAPRDLPPARFLALSGGADDGAFGAGLLNGWSAARTRPQFKLVTGISTGALIAPFAYLGSNYDSQLKEVFTTLSADRVFRARSILAGLTADAMSDTSPLFALITKYLNEDMLAKIAREYDKGRLLLIMTTNLDAARPVIWNIGAIAKQGGPDAATTIRKILLASAAIPGAFPPVMFDVEVDGKAYQELHVDGGAVAQTFLYTPGVRLKRTGRKRIAYIIRNQRLMPSPDKVERRTLSIAGRAISVLIVANGVGDIYRMYAMTKRDKVDFNLAYIGEEFTQPYPSMFDQTYMRALFAYGFEKARKGYSWAKSPPGLFPDRHAGPPS